MRGRARCRRPSAPLAALRTVTEPVCGVSRSAFSTRFDAICSTRSWSASTAAVALGAESHTESPRGRLVAGDHLAGNLGEVDRLAPHRELVAVHPREVEQVVDEAFEPAGLDEDDPRRLLSRERSLREPLGVAADRGQRRLQLMADREQEGALARPRGCELVVHLVERAGERGELARSLLGKRGRLLDRRPARYSRRPRA